MNVGGAKARRGSRPDPDLQKHVADGLWYYWPRWADELILYVAGRRSLISIPGRHQIQGYLRHLVLLGLVEVRSGRWFWEYRLIMPDPEAELALRALGGDL